MLKPLITTFKITGNGLKTLKEIKKNYDDLKNSFKKGSKDIENSFVKPETRFRKFVKEIKNGAVEVGNAFKMFGARSSTILENMNKRGNKLFGKFGKIAAVVGGGFTIKNAFEGATATEMNRTAIMSMVGEKRADELMAFGVNFANTTPFQTGEVLEAVKKLEIRGLDPTEWLRGVGDMSAMLGKSLDQGVEAVLDAVTGEFERLKEFGLTGAMLREMFPTRFEKNGAIKDIKGFVDDLMKYITKKYKGGTEVLAKTTTGLLSTIKGMYGSFANMLLSGTATGKILDNSPLGILRTEILQPLANDLIKWSEDGTFKKWSDDFSNAFSKVFSLLRSGYEIFKEYKDIILAITAAFISLKASLTIASGIMKIITLFSGLGALASPVGLIMIFITSLAFFTTLLIKNIDKIKEKFSDFYYFLLELWDEIKKVIVEMSKVLFESIINIPREWGKIFKSGWKSVKEAFGISTPETPTIATSKDLTVQEQLKLANNGRETKLNTIDNHSSVINFTINGAVNPEEVARQVENTLYLREIRSGER